MPHAKRKGATGTDHTEGDDDVGRGAQKREGRKGEYTSGGRVDRVSETGRCSKETLRRLVCSPSRTARSCSVPGRAP
jgi:hypothetical protein